MPDERERKPCQCHEAGVCMIEDEPPEVYCKIAAHDELKEKADFVDWLTIVAPETMKKWRESYHLHTAREGK